MSAVLVAVDLRGIQGYVFGSRRLQDAIGRALQISDLTDPRHPRMNAAVAQDAVIVAAGAGGLTVRCPDADAARRFTARYTRWVRDVSDALVPVVAHIADPGTTVTGAQVQAALRKARSTADSWSEPAPHPGFTADCEVTLRPAEMLGDGERGAEMLSLEVAAARTRARTWDTTRNRQLTHWTRTDLQGSSWIPTVTTLLDQLGRSHGVSSRLAVLHADINDLGALLVQHTDLVAADPQHTAPMGHIADLIREVVAALADHLQRVLWNRVTLKPGSAQLQGLPPRLDITLPTSRPPSGNGPTVATLPLRPIVIAGDDLTVVCDSRLAWTVAADITAWLDQPLDEPTVDSAVDPRARLSAASPVFRQGNRLALTAGIGIAVFPVGAPLTGAHDVSAQLTRFAKENRVPGRHAIAWSLTEREAGDPLTRLQQRRELSLTAQPYTGEQLVELLGDYLGEGPQSLRGPDWSGQRSWLKSVLPALLPTAADQRLAHEISRRADQKLPVTLPGAAGGSRTAISDDHHRGMLADALELLDDHLHTGTVEGVTR